MDTPYDSDNVPPPSYSEQEFDQKISQTHVASYTPIAYGDNRWASSPSTSEGSHNVPSSVYPMQYGSHSSIVRDKSRGHDKKSTGSIKPLQLVTHTERKPSGFRVTNQCSPISPEENTFPASGHRKPLPPLHAQSASGSRPQVNTHEVHRYPRDWDSESNLDSPLHSPPFDSRFSQMNMPSPYQNPPQTPRRALPPRPSQPQHQAMTGELSHSSSQLPHLSFDPSVAYQRSAPVPHPSVQIRYDPLSLYNPSVSAQMTPRRTNEIPLYSGQSQYGTRPESTYTVESSRMSMEDNDQFSQSSGSSYHNNTYGDSSTARNTWYSGP